MDRDHAAMANMGIYEGGQPNAGGGMGWKEPGGNGGGGP